MSQVAETDVEREARLLQRQKSEEAAHLRTEAAEMRSEALSKARRLDFTAYLLDGELGHLVYELPLPGLDVARSILEQELTDGLTSTRDGGVTRYSVSLAIGISDEAGAGMDEEARRGLALRNFVLSLLPDPAPN